MQGAVALDLDLERDCRLAAFAWLAERQRAEGDVLTSQTLRAGFVFRGQNVSLIVQQGIYKPKFLRAALSLRTAVDGPYDDRIEPDDTLLYRYQGTDPGAPVNRAVREAMRHDLPLVHFYGVAKARYLPLYPVHVVGDDPAELCFRVRAEADPMQAVSSVLHRSIAPDPTSPLRELERAYRTRLARVRVHQATFRERVLAAYRSECAMCRLRHPRLLDAAHIVPDSAPTGVPLVTNGISLCRIHHAAFDAHYLSVEPTTHRIHLRPDLLAEEDGPMLRHGLQELHHTRLRLPRAASQRPNPDALLAHWTDFHAAS